jgi:hypothetical protein
MKNVFVFLITTLVIYGGYSYTMGVDHEEAELNEKYYEENIMNATAMHLSLLQKRCTIPVPVLIEMNWSSPKHANSYVNLNPKFKNKSTAIWVTNQNLIAFRKERLLTMQQLYEKDLKEKRFGPYNQALSRTSN